VLSRGRTAGRPACVILLAGMKIGIVDHADCAHFLPDHPKCGTPHGHTYRVELVVEGDLRDGMVMDFADLKQALHRVLARYDHRSWNDFLAYPSVENICELLHRDLREHFSFPCTLRVWEGDGKWAEL
jgi:6-pyruvoyltetrahydropterin/6-carboxytetrahydropterin synthase